MLFVFFIWTCRTSSSSLPPANTKLIAIFAALCDVYYSMFCFYGTSGGNIWLSLFYDFTLGAFLNCSDFSTTFVTMIWQSKGPFITVHHIDLSTYIWLYVYVIVNVSLSPTFKKVYGPIWPSLPPFYTLSESNFPNWKLWTGYLCMRALPKRSESVIACPSLTESLVNVSLWQWQQHTFTCMGLVWSRVGPHLIAVQAPALFKGCLRLCTLPHIVIVLPFLFANTLSVFLVNMTGMWQL